MLHQLLKVELGLSAASVKGNDPLLSLQKWLAQGRPQDWIRGESNVRNGNICQLPFERRSSRINRAASRGEAAPFKETGPPSKEVAFPLSFSNLFLILSPEMSLKAPSSVAFGTPPFF
jgi:hypothetical protein